MREKIRALLPQPPAGPQDCRQLLRQLESQFPELTPMRQLAELQEMALEVVFRAKSPKSLKKALQTPPLQAEPLHRLASLVQRLEIRKEGVLDSQGKPQQRQAYWCGPLLIEVLEEISAAAGQAWPEVPSVGEVLSWYWPVRPPQAQTLPSLQPLHKRLSGLAQLDQQVEQAGQKVSLLDRINFFTDSPAESNEKQIKAERKEAERLWAEARQDYHDQVAALRSQQEGGFLGDRLFSLVAALELVSTQTGRSRSPKDCHLNNADSLLPDCQWLQEKQAARHGFQGDYASLVPQVCKAQAGEHDLPSRLKAQLGDALNQAVRAAELAASELIEAGHFTQHTQKQVTTMDKLNVFTDSPREKAVKEAQRHQQHCQSQAQLAEQDIQTVLRQGLQAFPAANLFYMCQDLLQKCQEVRPVCRTERVSVGSGSNTEWITEYWCEVEGLTEARQQANLCARTLNQWQGKHRGLYNWLSHCRLAQIQDPGLAGLRDYPNRPN